MITVTKLTGSPFVVNPDLLVKAEKTPDTVLTFIDGSKQIVRETPEQLSELIVQYRARVAAATVRMTESSLTGNTTAATVTELNSRRGEH